jgi:hypothetical protein
VTVQREAAVACLRIAEDKAVLVLEQIGAHAGWDDKYPALGALDNWRWNGMVVYASEASGRASRGHPSPRPECPCTNPRCIARMTSQPSTR